MVTLLPTPHAPATRTDWLLACEEDYDRCCELVSRFMRTLDMGEEETALMGCREDRAELQAKFFEWLEVNW